jgi:hypothetical protein
MSWAEWKADALNRLFQKYGVLKQRARITAETVRHGESRLPAQKSAYLDFCRSSDEVRPAKVRPAEVRLAEVRPVEIRPAEVRPVEVRPVEVRPSEVWILMRLATPRVLRLHTLFQDLQVLWICHKRTTILQPATGMRKGSGWFRGRRFA